jgi:hypothetical protein
MVERIHLDPKIHSQQRVRARMIVSSGKMTITLGMDAFVERFIKSLECSGFNVTCAALGTMLLNVVLEFRRSGHKTLGNGSVGLAAMAKALRH